MNLLTLQCYSQGYIQDQGTPQEVTQLPWGVSKCPRDTNGLLPPPKQSKIGDFYPTQVSIRNRSEVLADNDNEDTDGSNELPLSMQEAAGSNKLINNCASVDQPKDKAHLTNISETNSDVADNKDSNCASAHLCSLVARTLELIWNNLSAYQVRSPNPFAQESWDYCRLGKNLAHQRLLPRLIPPRKLLPAAPSIKA